MGFFDRARSTAIETAATLQVVRHLPWVLPSTEWNGGRILAENARKYGSRPALAYLDERYTWKQYNDKANQYADFFRKQGIGKGDTVALVMDNRSDFLFAFMGINKLRAVSALINTNLTGKAITHAINIGNPKAVLIGSEHVAAVKEVDADFEGLDPKKDIFVQLDEGKGDSGGYRVINDEVAACSIAEHSTKSNRPSTGENMCLIYTSGTTGLPKAAVITNQRWLMAGLMFGRSLHAAKPSDVIYVALPLYHSSAQFGGVGATLSTGAALALRRKFSASNFWNDVRNYGATRFMYIGELCRYLLNHPVQPGERDHKLKMGVGNGLRPDIWEKFQDRFGVPLMREFYGATEGNAPLVNLEGRPGLVGRLRPGQVIVKCDPATGDLVRNSDGWCEAIKPGEKGLLIAKINPVMRFDGYLDKKATEKKIFNDVFEKGDKYFNSGDLMGLHKDRWVSFADRIGDTFRWKGENVATNEVAEILNGASGVLETNVYGVLVPGKDGRCGMASINVNGEFDLESFAKFVNGQLPNYQRPYFIRVQHEMKITQTFKHQKVDYRDQAYDPAKVEDPLYYLDGENYVPIDAELYKKLESGEVGPR